ncbi:hypothetical protein [Indiicoccus explosivorum]|uniref:hypothetical protein n=1 Tax=Indiicoccus explosivorum TaxID=1917864 RepID=UPI000B4328D7|nr:hypothetical protein [Indiicoccus explosivorum]
MVIMWEGQELTLLEQPYLDDSLEQPIMRAHAKDLSGNRYDVQWHTVQDYTENVGRDEHVETWGTPDAVYRL